MFTHTSCSPSGMRWKDGAEIPPEGKLLLYRTASHQAMGWHQDGEWFFANGQKESEPVLVWSVLGE